MDSQEETLDERCTIMCSKLEKRAVKAVAQLLERTESDLLREMLIADVVASYHRSRQAVA